MRKGANPAKGGLQAYQPKRLGIGLLTYLPNREGYFEQGLEILKIQIASIYHATAEDFDLWVFDNGSCEEVVEELHKLQRDGWINFLISSSHNAGKTGALNVLLGGMPNDWICFSDSDVLFRKGWFETTCAIFQAFPEAGLVTAQPCFYDVLRGEGKAHLPLLEDPRYLVEDLLPEREAVLEYIESINLPVGHRAKMQETPVKVVSEKKSGVRAVIGATHMQFLMPKRVARSILPLPAKLGLSRDEDFLLDKRVDEAGWMHLSTLVPYVYHMGNVLDEKTRLEATQAGYLDLQLFTNEKKRDSEARWQLRLMNYLGRYGFFKQLFRKLYSLLFKYHAQ
jgi:glycosyltransferase involved in cell wall biosynthesis